MTRQALLLVTVGVSGAVLMALAALVVHETRRTLAFDRRLAAPRKAALTVAPRPEAREGGAGGDLRFSLRAAGLGILRVGSMLVPVGAAEREKLVTQLRHAGFGQPDALSLLLSAKLAAAVVVGAGAGLLAAGQEALAGSGLVVALVAAGGLIAGSVAPEYVLRSLKNRRTRGMSAALPDAFDLMVMSLEAGLTFERALLTVADELASIEPSLAREFRLMEAELRLGANRRAVLQDFHERSPVQGLRNLALTLLQSDRYGTPLTQSMKNIAGSERDERASQSTARAERLPVLMTLPMLAFVVPGTILLVAGPAFLTAMQALSSLGR